MICNFSKKPGLNTPFVGCFRLVKDGMLGSSRFISKLVRFDHSYSRASVLESSR